MPRFVFAACTAAALAACAHTTVAETPKETIAALDKQYATYFNAGSYDKLAAMYHPDSDVVPPTADRFVKHSQLQALFAGFAKEGLEDIALEPLNVIEETDTLWHEIGNLTHKGDPSGGLYYARWIKPDTEWLYAFDMMVMGNGLKKKAAPADDAKAPVAVHKKRDNVTQIVDALETMWTALLDTGDYEGLAAMYNPGAQLIPPSHSTEFLTQDKFAVRVLVCCVRMCLMTFLLTLVDEPAATGWRPLPCH